jgi:hypothetical protein
MRKIGISLCCIALLLLAAYAGYCAHEEEITNGATNGLYIMRCIENGKGSAGYEIALSYIHGIIDGFWHLGKSSTFAELYGGKTTFGEMCEAVILYYKNNPSQRSRSVTEVVLSGAK